MKVVHEHIHAEERNDSTESPDSPRQRGTEGASAAPTGPCRHEFRTLDLRDSWRFAQDDKKVTLRLSETVREAFGVKLTAVMRLIVGQALVLSESWMKRSGADLVDGGMGLLIELEPRNAQEALLATTMIGTQAACAEFLHRAMLLGQTVEGTDANVLRAMRLGRLFNEQLETLMALRGKKGRQRMTVKHVTVQAGGQAIVGNVSNQRGVEGGGGDEPAD